MTSVLEPALPRLQEAHRLMWEVREHCADDAMTEALTGALEANRDAQHRLNKIASIAREAAS